MMNNFALPPAFVRELGYMFNGGQHSGWADRASELLGVSPRTVEAWARGERECQGPPALLIAYLARMIANGTYSDISLDEVNWIVQNHGKKAFLNLDLPEVRTSIRSIIKFTSSIKKIAIELSINRSALSRWLSGENALGYDSIAKVLDHIGLTRDVHAQCEKTWRVRLDQQPTNELIEDIRHAIKLFFPHPPECSLIQLGKPEGRPARVNANLRYQKTTITIEFSMPSKLARHDQSLIWLIPAFIHVSSLTCYCTFDIESDSKRA
jgi:transcriptional regulator with XRE-family HTH domain